MRPTRSQWDRIGLKIKRIGKKSTLHDCCVCIANEKRPCGLRTRSLPPHRRALSRNMQPINRAKAEGRDPCEAPGEKLLCTPHGQKQDRFRPPS